MASVVASVNSPYVDGSFSDDVGGLPEEHPNAAKNTNLTADQLVALQLATAQTHQKLVDALVAAGKVRCRRCRSTLLLVALSNAVVTAKFFSVS